jgi:hypothetical protein
MPRRARITAAGVLHHVVRRGHNREEGGLYLKFSQAPHGIS